MASLLIFLCVTSFLPLISIASPLPINSTAAGQQVVQGLPRNGNLSSLQGRKLLGVCNTGNPVDNCWRCDPNWANNRQRLADCGIGFGRDAMGGKNGKAYMVTDPSDHPENPTPGTLRYGLLQEGPLWITFATDMTITPKQNLVVTSYKTIDGRGAAVVVGEGGGCLELKDVSHVIIVGLTMRNCKPTRQPDGRMSDGDGITVFHSTDVWIDHCTLEACTDGLVDVTEASTRVTLTNNLFMNHNKAILLGHSDYYTDDKVMQVTVAFNRFGPGLVQRMPRCRLGVFHVINNDYIGWQSYAIGGSAAPTILSHGNRFLADTAKECCTNNPEPWQSVPRRQGEEVTKRDDTSESVWSTWTWLSEGDLMLNGAFFRSSGHGGGLEVKTPSFAQSASLMSAMTASVGVLSCKKGSLC